MLLFIHLQFTNVIEKDWDLVLVQFERTTVTKIQLPKYTKNILDLICSNFASSF